ncbi:MAG: nucleotide sugar dehydrogenase [Candidatus Peribacteraceae bacterium]|nr:nucleotide sugar dehydrogenase [Candidatus Peribacteraceae bacterium]
MASSHLYDVTIIGGFGHVGLPLGIVFADCGLKVALYDLDTSKRAGIEAGVMPFIEYGADPILRKVIGKNLTVADSLEVCRQSKIVLVTIGTPVDEYLSPKTSPLFKLAESIFPFLTADQCLVLRSTVFPGTSQALVDFFRDHGCPVELAFCPERIVQGYAIQELRTLPQIISGSSPKAVAIAQELFGRLKVETIETTMEEAEFTKLFLNSWRYIQFAVGNQFYMMARDHGLDYQRIHHAMTHHYKRGDIPGPGFAAGPCLLKDTMQLSAAFRNQFFIGHAAMMINEGLPAFVIDHLLRETGGSIHGKTVAILGMAFKGNIDDVRDSLSFKVAKFLRFHGATVLTSDEFAKRPELIPAADAVNKAEIIIIGVPHSAYKSLVIPKEKKVVDLWNVLPPHAA